MKVRQAVYIAARLVIMCPVVGYRAQAGEYEWRDYSFEYPKGWKIVADENTDPKTPRRMNL